MSGTSPIFGSASQRTEVREPGEEVPDGWLASPKEGWIAVAALALMMLVLAFSIDDAAWAGYAVGGQETQTAFLRYGALFSVFIGIALAKSRLGTVSAHFIGAALGVAYMLISIGSVISTAPTIEGRLRAVGQSVATFANDLFVLGIRSAETTVFLLLLGSLLWAAGLFGAFAVFRRQRPMPAIVLVGVMLLINVSLTVREQYLHLIVFAAAALVLLVRLNLLQQIGGWRARGIRDLADVSGAFMRSGAVFVAVAVVGSITLAANASSAPLGRVWRDLDEQLLEVGYEINRWMGGVSGAARGPSVLFTPSQTIRDQWESSQVVVFTYTSSDGEGHYQRGATYDSFDGRTWQQLDRRAVAVPAGEDVLAVTRESVATGPDRREVVVSVTPVDYGGDIFVSPDSPLRIDGPTEVLTNLGGGFIAAKLTDGIEAGAPYTVNALIREGAGEDNAVTANELAAAGIEYPDWVRRFTEVREGSVGPSVFQTADTIVAGLLPERRDPYHIAEAVQNYLYRTGGFQYRTDVRGLCRDQTIVDCFLRVRRGYCEYFATAMVMMLRTQGIPTRYATGYLPGTRIEESTFEVDRAAAHSWVEVYFPEYGWIRFDPTPGNTELGQQPTVLEPGPPVATPRNDGAAPATPRFIPDDPIDGIEPGSVIGVPPTRPGDPTDNPLTPVIMALLVIVLLLLGLVAFLRRMPTSEPEIAYNSVTRMARRLGYGPRASQTAYEFSDGLGELVPVVRSDLRMIATAKVEATYANRRPGESMLRTLAQAYRRVRIGLLRLLFRRRIGPRGPRSTD